jgi:DNA-binding IclR family transcriptional regulator
MKSKSQTIVTPLDTAKRSYAAPALDKGLDILEMLCTSDHALQQKEIADQLGRSVGEIYRMLSCLVSRGYVAQLDDTSYTLTTKLFELAHINPPTQRLLFEATPVMQRLANELDQSCHLTIYSQGKQVVLAKVDTPSGMGFSVRAGSELEVLISASGRVLLAFQSEEVTAWRIEESSENRFAKAPKDIATVLKAIRIKGYESIPSVQVRGLHAVSFPILDTRGHAIAALTVPYSERIDQSTRKSIADVTKALGLASAQLSARMGGPQKNTSLPLVSKVMPKKRPQLRATP